MRCNNNLVSKNNLNEKKYNFTQEQKNQANGETKRGGINKQFRDKMKGTMK